MTDLTKRNAWSGVRRDLIPILSTITNQPIEAMVTFLNHASIVVLCRRTAFRSRHPRELAGLSWLIPKLEVSDPPMNLINLLVRFENFGISAQGRIRDKLCD